MPRPVRMELALAGARIVPVLGLGAELLTMTARRCPAQSSSLVCASATPLVPNPGSPRVPEQRLAGMTPGHSSAASALSCALAAGLTGPCYARRAANGVDVWTAAAQPAVALVLFVCVAIPLLREKSQLAPRQSLILSAIWFWTNLRAWRAGLPRSVLLPASSGVASGGSIWTGTPVVLVDAAIAPVADLARRAR